MHPSIGHPLPQLLEPVLDEHEAALNALSGAAKFSGVAKMVTASEAPESKQLPNFESS